MAQRSRTAAAPRSFAISGARPVCDEMLMGQLACWSSDGQVAMVLGIRWCPDERSEIREGGPAYRFSALIGADDAQHAGFACLYSRSHRIGSVAVAAIGATSLAAAPGQVHRDARSRLRRRHRDAPHRRAAERAVGTAGRD